MAVGVAVGLAGNVAVARGRTAMGVTEGSVSGVIVGRALRAGLQAVAIMIPSKRLSNLWRRMAGGV